MARTGTFRGGVPIGNQMYGAWEDEVYLVSKEGTATYLSTLAGAGNVTFGRNSLSPNPDIAVVTTNGAYIVNTTAAAVQNYPDSDVNAPGVPTCCCGYLGYIFFGYSTGVLQVTKYNSTTIETLDQAATVTNYDGILSIFGYDGQIYACGEQSIEVWGEPINPTGFPLTRVGFNITPGIISKKSIAGWEQEWGYPPIYVGSDGTVRQIQGYQSVTISNSDIEREIQELSSIQRSEITCLVYNTGGNAFWQCNLGPKSWVYHIQSGSWHERKSQDLDDSRLINSVFFYKQWIVGDTESNAVYTVDSDTNTEAGSELTAVVESGPLKEFPYRQRINRADFDFTVGVGETTGSDVTQTDPQCQIEVSYDGGHTWPHSWNRKLGKEGKYFRRVYVNGVGLTGDEGVKFRWSVSDPIHVGFQGGNVDLSVLSK